MKLKDKVAIVTGGSRGIGAAMAKAYAAEGATVIIVNKNNPHEGQQAADAIIQAGGVAHAKTCDIADPASINKLVSSVLEEHGHVDILLNSAGVLLFKSIEEHTLEDWNFVMNVNLTGPFLLSQAIIPHMKKQKSGKIIFISSLAAIRGISGAISYAASKGGVLAMAKSMVAELASYGINVNTISPGFTATPMNQNLRDDPDFLSQIKLPPTGNPMMQPDDLAGAALFLASSDSDHVNGLDLIIDEGATTIQ